MSRPKKQRTCIHGKNKDYWISTDGKQWWLQKPPRKEIYESYGVFPDLKSLLISLRDLEVANREWDSVSDLIDTMLRVHAWTLEAIEKVIEVTV